VKTGAIAVPSRILGVVIAPMVNGVKASVPATSDVHRSVNPASCNKA
jgi:hypothetical protein